MDNFLQNPLFRLLLQTIIHLRMQDIHTLLYLSTNKNIPRSRNYFPPFFFARKTNGGELFSPPKPFLLIIFCMRFEDERHDKREDDRRRNARARRRKRTRERLEQSLLRAAHCAVGKQIPEPRNGNGRPRSRELDQGLIRPERGERDSRKHEHDEDLSRCEVGKIDDKLCDGADEPAHCKRL